MDANDRAEIRQMFTDVLSGHVQEINGRYNVIHTNLIQIKEQTTKTNGRVTELEKKLATVEKTELQHVVNCPNTNRLTTLENKEIERQAVKRFSWKQAVIVSAIVTAVIMILQIVFKA